MVFQIVSSLFLTLYLVVVVGSVAGVRVEIEPSDLGFDWTVLLWPFVLIYKIITEAL